MIKAFFSWPGGKYLAAKYILPFIPTSIGKLCSPFLGGGTIELNCAAMGIEVRGYDIFEPLINFWQMAIVDCAQIKQKIIELKPKVNFTDEIIKIKSWVFDYTIDPITRAAALVVSTTCSFGSMPRANFFYHSKCKNLFEEECLDKRFKNLEIKNLTVNLQDFRQSIMAHTNDTFMYLDPPYFSQEEVYSKNTKKMIFDHKSLARLLADKKYWILSSNGHDNIRNLYAGYQYVDLSGIIAHPIKIVRKINSRFQTSEILIFSKGYAREWSDMLVLNCAKRL